MSCSSCDSISEKVRDFSSALGVTDSVNESRLPLEMWVMSVLMSQSKLTDKCGRLGHVARQQTHWRVKSRVSFGNDRIAIWVIVQHFVYGVIFSILDTFTTEAGYFPRLILLSWSVQTKNWELTMKLSFFAFLKFKLSSPKTYTSSCVACSNIPKCSCWSYAPARSTLKWTPPSTPAQVCSFFIFLLYLDTTKNETVSTSKRLLDLPTKRSWHFSSSSSR